MKSFSEWLEVRGSGSAMDAYNAYFGCYQFDDVTLWYGTWHDSGDAYICRPTGSPSGDAPWILTDRSNCQFSNYGVAVSETSVPLSTSPATLTYRHCKTTSLCDTSDANELSPPSSDKIVMQPIPFTGKYLHSLFLIIFYVYFTHTMLSRDVREFDLPRHDHNVQDM